MAGAERLTRINEILDRLEHNKRGKRKVKPDWKTELAYILEGGGKKIPVYVECDVYAEDRINNKKYAFELKAPLPNSDQTKVSKEKIFKLYAMEPMQVDGAFYALPYNPYGTRDRYDWSFPQRWFNMQEDEVVLIGDEFWDKIGGTGTYQAFLTAVNEIGPEYRKESIGNIWELSRLKTLAKDSCNICNKRIFIILFKMNCTSACDRLACEICQSVRKKKR